MRKIIFTIATLIVSISMASCVTINGERKIVVSDRAIWSDIVEHNERPTTTIIGRCITYLHLKLRNGSHGDWPNRNWDYLIEGSKVGSEQTRLGIGNHDSANFILLDLKKIDSSSSEECTFIDSITINPVDQSTGNGGAQFTIDYEYVYVE